MTGGWGDVLIGRPIAGWPPIPIVRWPPGGVAAIIEGWGGLTSLLKKGDPGSGGIVGEKSWYTQI